MMQPRWVIAAAIGLVLGTGTYQLLKKSAPEPSGRTGGELQMPARVIASDASDESPAPPAPRLPDGPSQAAQSAPANPDVKMVDGVKMLRGHTIHGEEVWIPAAPEPADMPQVAEQADPEFLPAPGQ